MKHPKRANYSLVLLILLGVGILITESWDHSSALSSARQPANSIPNSIDEVSHAGK